MNERSKQPGKRVCRTLEVCRAALSAGLVGMFLLAGTAHSGPLETLERERAVMLTTWLDPALSDEERFEKIRTSERRLVDFERILLRDTSASSTPSRDLRQAFESYDRTFLVHAALERETSVFAHWLEQLGFTSVRVLSADVGRR